MATAPPGDLAFSRAQLRVVPRATYIIAFFIWLAFYASVVTWPWFSDVVTTGSEDATCSPWFWSYTCFLYVGYDARVCWHCQNVQVPVRGVGGDRSQRWLEGVAVCPAHFRLPLEPHFEGEWQAAHCRGLCRGPARLRGACCTCIHAHMHVQRCFLFLHGEASVYLHVISDGSEPLQLATAASRLTLHCRSGWCPLMPEGFGAGTSLWCCTTTPMASRRSCPSWAGAMMSPTSPRRSSSPRPSTLRCLLLTRSLPRAEGARVRSCIRSMHHEALGR